MSRSARRIIRLGLGLCLFGLILRGEIYYPWKEGAVGALHASSWAGLVLAPAPGCVFAFRVRVEKANWTPKVDKEKGTAEGNDLFYLVSEVGPHSPDGQYARVSFDMSLPFGLAEDTPILIKPARSRDTLTLEWSRLDERMAVGRLKGPRTVKLDLVHYFPWDMKGRYRATAEGRIQGEVREPKTFHYFLWTDPRGTASPGQNDQELPLSFSLNKEQEIYFAVGVGEEAKQLAGRLERYQNRRAIASFLEEEQDRYLSKRVKLTGPEKGLAESITNNLFWMILYQPDHHRLYTPAGRKWIFPKPDGSPDHWTPFSTPWKFPSKAKNTPRTSSGPCSTPSTPTATFPIGAAVSAARRTVPSLRWVPMSS
jgi:hypothetical protein